jgi:phage-related protein
MEICKLYLQSSANDPAWVQLDLRGQKACGGLRIVWGDDYAAAYAVELSANGLNWYPVFTSEQGRGGEERILWRNPEARFLRVHCRASATAADSASANWNCSRRTRP